MKILPIKETGHLLQIVTLNQESLRNRIFFLFSCQYWLTSEKRVNLGDKVARLIYYLKLR